MTKAQALYDFFNSFGISAYPSTNVPDGVEFPYLTYESNLGSNFTEVYPTVNLYYYTDSEAIPNAKADAISKAIGLGKSLKTDDGAIYVYHDNAWQSLIEDNNSAIKRRYTQFHIVFNTF